MFSIIRKTVCNSPLSRKKSNNFLKKLWRFLITSIMLLIGLSYNSENKTVQKENNWLENQKMNQDHRFSVKKFLTEWWGWPHSVLNSPLMLRVFQTKGLAWSFKAVTIVQLKREPVSATDKIYFRKWEYTNW